MKNKIAIASAFIAASSFSTAEIVVNDFLSFEGFVDMSYSHQDTDYDGLSQNSESNNDFAVNQVEISWLFDFDPVTAQIDLQYLSDDDFNSTNASYSDGDIVEQAFATYHFEDGAGITAGRYASMLGFEAFEPTGLYQFSFAYDLQDANGDIGNVSINPTYAQGVKFTQEGSNTFFGISLQDQAFQNNPGRLGGSTSNKNLPSYVDSSWAVEVAGAYYMENGLSLFLGGAYEDADSGDSYMLNTYVTFETGAWLFAGEFSYGESDNGSFSDLSRANPFAVVNDEEVYQALLMANFAYSEKSSVTGRVSFVDHKVEGNNTDINFVKYTLAHNFAITDNLLLVNEISYVNGDFGSSDPTNLVGAVELLFSF